jgi:hypothetical protein
MYFIALAADYDGTLATDGGVDSKAYASLEAFRRAGRYVILVTGRQLEDLLPLIPNPTLFDRIVAENGAVLADEAKRIEDDRELAPSQSHAQIAGLIRQRYTKPATSENG